ncbi:DUF402 domain-containing protein [Paenarthrobacter sp. PH39-S1]|uniref:DUF402 domain-containing protein n=1 Tax=Micrococcaceae TaxID=1268 RepID=UPI0024B99610|nr:DUF402 domain-containing protein [Paenarthrobacter sp. PH39-S1]MDJ0357393.1 DUF402 domain-containing protein [Paenarthrobacter sp. PH39-S1]
MSRPEGIEPGDLVVARNRKWNAKPHWVVPGRYLGEDQYGWWIFQGSNEFISRPGAALYTASDAVLLIPRSGSYVATFFDERHPDGTELYVDLAVDPGWNLIRPHVFEFHLIDMDLDVIRRRAHGAFVDDEDEFAEHQVAMGYPAEVITGIRSECDRILAAVTARQGPFDGTDTKWFENGRA